MAVPPVRGWYESELGRGRNTARWIEYSVSASVMVVLKERGWVYTLGLIASSITMAFLLGGIIAHVLGIA